MRWNGSCTPGGSDPIEKDRLLHALDEAVSA
jgi:hypothetical protein